MPFEEEKGCFIATATYRTPTVEELDRIGDEIKDWYSERRRAHHITCFVL